MTPVIQAQLDSTIRDSLAVAATPPQKRQAPTKGRWTLKRLVTWVKPQFGIDCCRETVRQVLRRLGFSWKKAHKLLNKGNPDKRAAFLERLKGLLDDALQGRCLLVYIDEAHIHLDTDAGYGWSLKGQRFWVSSSAPGRAKVSFYGVYLYNLGPVRVFAYDKADQLNTIDVLKRLRVEFPDTPLKLIWDGAPYHRARAVHVAATTLAVTIAPLPAYSPDFMPVEHLWQWLREDITYHACFANSADLMQRVEHFQQEINADSLVVADRLWVKNHLDPQEEKLRVSS